MVLAEARRRANLSVSQLVSLSGVSRDCVFALEGGASKCSLATLDKLCKALNEDVTEAMAFYWSEKPGDPCLCGCGGVKVFPKTRKGWTLRVSCPCRTCGRNRIYDGSQRHRILCPSCSGMKPGPEAPDDILNHLQSMLQKALERNRITLDQACREAGISRASVRNWVRGRCKPYKHRLERFAAALGEPTFAEIVPSRIHLNVWCELRETRNHYSRRKGASGR